jgi:YjbE family integral membrane protein
MNPMLLNWIGIVVAIILVDLTLSGDNALVIGAAAAKLHGRARRYAITFGGIMAIILRIILASGAVLLLQIPFVRIVAGLAVFIIALQLIGDMYQNQQAAEGADQGRSLGFGLFKVGSDSTFVRACLTIVVADVSMSIDNILAIAALSHGNFPLLAIGLLLSVGMLLVASALIAKLIERLPWLLYIAGAILAFTAGSLIVEDKELLPTLNQWDVTVPGPLLVYLEIAFVLIFAVVALWQFAHRQPPQKKGKDQPPTPTITSSTPSLGQVSRPR